MSHNHDHTHRQSDQNILIAFLLKLIFSVVELIGGTLTGSVAILSDAVHDLGDAVSIGVSYFLEKKSKKGPDDVYTYGYARYSVMGSVFTTLILLVGSILVIIHAIDRLFNPVTINYDGMMLLALLGVVVNFLAAYYTRGGDSMNQKAVNLHMMEDVLGWAAVLVGAVVMRFTGWNFIDPLLSLAVAAYILINALKHLSNSLYLFLEKIPQGVSMEDIEEKVLSVPGVRDVHHIHAWSLDGKQHFVTMHVVTDEDPQEMKGALRQKLQECGLSHATIELETSDEHCHAPKCTVKSEHSHGHHHHHHHH
ncbi:MAG TPA: cation transporter [Clostridiales bacterium]|nr:cation transporter [Clostridiales bacterium]